jgi:hypothetical protein
MSESRSSERRSFDVEQEGESWISPVARLRDRQGRIVGAGVLTVGNLVLTCSHVINDALQTSSDNTTLGDDTELLVDFPFAGVYDVTVKVVGWYPPIKEDQRRRDSPPTNLAILEATKPDQIVALTPSSISDRNPQPDTAFSCQGFPVGYPNGAIAQGVLRGADAGGWIQAVAETTFGQFIEPGFSGAPVFARERGAVQSKEILGLVVAIDSDKSKRVALIIPPIHLTTVLGEIQRSRRELAKDSEGLAATSSTTDLESEVATAHSSLEDTIAQPDSKKPVESNTRFIPDDPELEHDELGRGVLAIVLGRRLHRIWCSLNHATPTSRCPSHMSSTEPNNLIESSAWTGRMHVEAATIPNHQQDYGRAGFVVHLDAPWGGGKTTFANFLARVMNPYGFEASGTSFLHQRYGDANIGSIFLQDPPLNASTTLDLLDWPEESRRPWVVVQFNAWRVEHCEPPWWVFYQTIREQCLSAVRRDGITPVDPRALEAPKKPRLENRLLLWFGLWIREYWWRLKNPKITTLLSTALIGIALIAILQSLGIIRLAGKPEELKPAFNVGDGIGLMFAGITAISAIWGIGSLITESIVPGTNTLAERLSLGSGDPFERFRRHFYQTMERVRRPVMVIIDDLDRCKPSFVVDLIRGIQTLLRSPRVVFVILGDRDWIERAFETHHKEMSQISVGPEQTFGARFVEKAVHMSFVLPGVRQDQQNDYVRWLLLGDRAPQAVKPIEALPPRTAAVLREVIRQTADVDKSLVSETERIRRDVASAYRNLPTTTHLVGDRASDSIINQFINDELAIRVAGDEEAEQEIAHRLDPLAAYLPPNPRQIKRIINAITMYHAVALQREGMDASDPRWLQLVLWVIVMTEWPATWRLIASFPVLIELLKSDDAEGRLKDFDVNKLPGSAEATLKEIRRIKADTALTALIVGSKKEAVPGLDRRVIEEFLSLTPIYGRTARVSDDPHVNGETGK